MVLFHLAVVSTTPSQDAETSAISLHHMIHQAQWHQKASITIEGPDIQDKCAIDPAADASPRTIADEILLACTAPSYTILENGEYVHLVSGALTDRLLDRTIALKPGVRPLKDVLAELVQQLSATMGSDDKPIFGSGGINGTHPLTQVEVPADGPKSARAWLRTIVPLPMSEWWTPMGLPIAYRARVVWALTEGPDTVSLQLKVLDQTDYLEDNEVWLGSWNQQRQTKLEWLRDRLRQVRTNPSPSYGPSEVERDVAMFERLIAEEEAKLARKTQTEP